MGCWGALRECQEERLNLVFAVKTSLRNSDHRLKVGMFTNAEIASYL